MPRPNDKRTQSTRDWIVDDIAEGVETVVFAIPILVAAAVASTVFDISLRNALAVGLALAIVARFALSARRRSRRSPTSPATPRRGRDDL